MQTKSILTSTLGTARLSCLYVSPVVVVLSAGRQSTLYLVYTYSLSLSLHLLQCALPFSIVSSLLYLLRQTTAAGVYRHFKFNIWSASYTYVFIVFNGCFIFRLKERNSEIYIHLPQPCPKWQPAKVRHSVIRFGLHIGQV